MTDYFHFVCTHYFYIISSLLPLIYSFFSFLFLTFILVTFDYVGVNIADISSSIVEKQQMIYVLCVLYICFKD